MKGNNSTVQDKTKHIPT